MKKEEWKEGAKFNNLASINGVFRAVVQLDFDLDRHYEISIHKGDTAAEIGNALVRHGKALISLSKKENWNEG